MLTEAFDDIITILERGGLILYPTDTIWGIGCDAFNSKAIDRISDLKKRPRDKPYILLIDSLQTLRRYVPRIHPRIETLLFYHSRPLTVIYKGVQELPDFVLAEDRSVAIRITLNSFCREMIKQFGRPIISTSANISGDPFPTNFEDISQHMIDSVDKVVAFRNYAEFENPSVIVKCSDRGELIFVRS